MFLLVFDDTYVGDLQVAVRRKPSYCTAHVVIVSGMAIGKQAPDPHAIHADLFSLTLSSLQGALVHFPHLQMPVSHPTLCPPPI